MASHDRLCSMELVNHLEKGIIPEEIYFGPQHDIRALSVQKVSVVIRELKNNTAPGEDSITAGIIKGGGRIL